MIWPVIVTLLFAFIFGINLWVGFTPFTIACVVFIGIMVVVSWTMALKDY